MSTGEREFDDESAATALLRVEDLTAGYGELIVLRELSLDVRAGEIHCVSGRNGAGKSTLMHTIAGLVRPSVGTLALAGEDITGQPAHRRPALGIGYVPQGRRLFGALTVAENLDLSAAPPSRPFAMRAGPVRTVRERTGERRATERRVGAHRRPGSRSSPASRYSKRAWSSAPTPSRAASSRCSPPPARSPSGRACC